MPLVRTGTTAKIAKSINFTIRYTNRDQILVLGLLISTATSAFPLHDFAGAQTAIQSSIQTPEFTGPYNLSGDNIRIEGYKIAASGDDAYVVWIDNTAGNYEVFFKARSDNKSAFEDAINLSNTDGDSTLADIAAVGDHVYVIWADNTFGNKQIFLRISHDNGRTFEEIIQINEDGKGIQGHPRLAALGNHVYILWSGVNPTPVTPPKDQIFDSIVVAWIKFWQDVLNRLNLPNIGNQADTSLHSTFLRVSTDNGKSFGEIIFLGTIARYNTPQIAASTDNLYVVWSDLVEYTPPPTDGGVWGPIEVFFKAIPTDDIDSMSKKGKDTGVMPLTSDQINISQNAGDSYEPIVEVYDNNVFVAWHDTSFYQTGKNEVMFKVSKDSGKSFTATVNLSNSSGNSYPRQIAATGNNVYVIWDDDSLENPGSFRKSHDGGETFEQAINLGYSNTGFAYPQIAAANDNFYVLWNGGLLGSNMLYVRSSGDNGSTFSIPIPLTLYGYSRDPEIVASEGNVYAVWTDNKSEMGSIDDIFFRAILWNGTRVGDIINLSNNPEDARSAQAKISAHGNNLYVVWTQYTDTTSDVFYAVSGDKGLSFDVTNLSNTEGNSYDPQIVADNQNNIYVMWLDTDKETGQRDIFLKVLIEGADAFSPAINVSESAVDVSDPHIEVADGSVYIVWYEAIPDGTNAKDIFFRASNDNGATFGHRINLSNNTSDSYYPTIDAHTNRVYVAWVDASSGEGQEKDEPGVIFRLSTDRGLSFGNKVNLSESGNMTLAPEKGQVLALPGTDRVFVAWEAYPSGIFFVKSDDNGSTFSKIVKLSNSSSTSRVQIAAAADNSKLYATWVEGDIGEIYFTTAYDNATQFSPILNLSNNTSPSFNQRIVTQGSEIYVVWQDEFSSGSDIFLKRSPLPPPVRID